MEPDEAERLGRAVTTWIDDVLAIDRAEAARRTGLSDTKLRSIERGDPVQHRRSTLRKLERGLGWHDHAADDIRRGLTDVAGLVVMRGGDDEEVSRLLVKVSPDDADQPNTAMAVLLDMVMDLQHRVARLEYVAERHLANETPQDAQ